MGWYWHHLDHMMQIICTSLQTDNHASTSSLTFLRAGCSSCRRTNNIKTLVNDKYDKQWCQFCYAVLFRCSIVHVLSTGVSLCCCTSASDIYYRCVNAINCTRKSMSDNLLWALDIADANMYLCSKELRPGEQMISSV